MKIPQKDYNHNLKQIIKEALDKQIFKIRLTEAVNDNLCTIQTFINEEMGISNRRQTYTDRVIEMIETKYNISQDVDATPLYAWVEFATSNKLPLNYKKIYSKINGTYIQFSFNYGAVEIEMNCFVINSPSLKWVKENLAYFNFNGSNEKPDQDDECFKHKVYLTIPRINKNFANVWVEREVSHELSHIDQKVYSGKETLIRGENFRDRYEQATNGGYFGKKELQDIYDMSAFAIHDANDFELTAIIQASHRQIMLLVKKYWDGKGKIQGTSWKGINELYTKTSAYNTLINMINLKEYLNCNLNNTDVNDMLKKHFQYSAKQLVKLCNMWIPKYQSKIGRMFGKIAKDMDEAKVISYGHWN